MKPPMKILKQTDFEKQLDNLQTALQNLRATYDLLNQSFYQFLEQNPEIRERYREFASGHPEETWDFHAESYVDAEPKRVTGDEENDKQEPDQTEERQQQTETRDWPIIGWGNH